MTDSEIINTLLGIIDDNNKKLAEKNEEIDCLKVVIEKLKESIVIMEEQNDKN